MNWRQELGQGLGKLGEKRGLIYLKVNGGLTQNVCCCSFAQSCLTLCNSMDCSTPCYPVLHHLLEFAQTHVHWVSDAIQSTSKCLEFAKLNPFFPIFFVSYSCTIFLWGDSESGSFARHKFQRYNKAKSPESQESIRGDRTKKKNLEII